MTWADFLAICDNTFFVGPTHVGTEVIAPVQVGVKDTGQTIKKDIGRREILWLGNQWNQTPKTFKIR